MKGQLKQRLRQRGKRLGGRRTVGCRTGAPVHGSPKLVARHKQLDRKYSAASVSPADENKQFSVAPCFQHL
jgi:hypothetical protein